VIPHCNVEYKCPTVIDAVQFLSMVKHILGIGPHKVPARSFFLLLDNYVLKIRTAEDKLPNKIKKLVMDFCIKVN
jgi:hypothetical protein